MNVAGEKFDIQRTGTHNFLSIPRGADPEHADLRVQGRVDLRGDACRGQRYITELNLTGSWLGDMRSVVLSTGTEEFNTPGTIGLGVAGSGNVSVEDFVSRVAPGVLELLRFHPERPGAMNQHVATLVAKLSLGPVKMKVTWVHTKEKAGFSNSLMLLASGLGRVPGRIGGLLGEDSHKLVSAFPAECFPGSTGHFFVQEPPRGGVRAMALMDGAEDDEDDEDEE